MPRTVAFLRHYLRPRPRAVEAVEVAYRRGAEVLPATLYRSAGGRGPRPGWVLLHGLTCRGRAHPALERFARALAASGPLVLVPEVPEWTRLRPAPGRTLPAIPAAVRALAALDGAAADRIGVIGFSFGATQALIAAADPGLDGALRGVAAWGGYADLHRLFRFGITGEFELDGRERRLEPDPYGRWVMGGTYLTAVRGLEGYGELAGALHRLALEAGRVGAYAGTGAYDPLKRALRAGLPAGQRWLFDLFAPPAGEPVPDLDRARALAAELADAALRTDPLLDPGPYLAAVHTRTVLAHGQDDRLVPFTETIRLARALPPTRRAGATVTALFAHSGRTTRGLGPSGLAREAVRFGALLRRILGLL